MNRRTRLALVLGLSLVMAATASVGLYIAVMRMQRTADPEPQMPVVVATRAVAMGTLLTADDVRVVNFPAATPLKGVFADTGEVLKRGLLASVVENEPITATKLAPLEAGGGLPPQIHPGMRAISVKVNEVIGVAGFVQPGARVDVVVTLRQQSDSTSRIVVSNVQVLTAGTRFDQDQAKDGKAVPTTVVTLMVSPEDAERIALAAAEGQLVLTLRNPLDKGNAPTPGVRTAGLIGTQSYSPPVERAKADSAVPRVAARTARAPQAPAAPAVYTVHTIRGMKQAQEVIR